jgi:hypothetical protein
MSRIDAKIVTLGILRVYSRQCTQSESVAKLIFRLDGFDKEENVAQAES